jgi:hypothetical protein
MFGWFRGGRNLPSTNELESSVAASIDGFIDRDGLEEFSRDRFFVVIAADLRVSILERRLVRDALVAVPLSDLNLELAATRASYDMRHMAVGTAARSVVEKLPPPQSIRRENRTEPRPLY